MKKVVLILLLGGLLLIGTGCGGGGGGGGSDTTTPTLYVNVAGTYTINLAYEITNSSGDTIKMTVVSIEVESDQTLKVNCAWKVTSNSSGSDNIIKISDADTATFYIVDNNGKKYYHTDGDGAAYTTTTLSTTAVSGSYYFPALKSGVTSIYFYDSDYSKKTGLILVSSST